MNRNRTALLAVVLVALAGVAACTSSPTSSAGPELEAVRPAFDGGFTFGSGNFTATDTTTTTTTTSAGATVAEEDSVSYRNGYGFGSGN